MSVPGRFAVAVVAASLLGLGGCGGSTGTEPAVWDPQATIRARAEEARRGLRGRPRAGGRPRARSRPAPAPAPAPESVPAPAPDSVPAPASAPEPLTPWDAARLAVEQNPQLRAIRAQRGIAHAQIIQAGILPNPQASGWFMIPVAGGGERQSFGYEAVLQWNLTPLFALGSRVAAANEGALAVDLEVAWQEWQIATAARLHAVRALYLSRRIALARQVEERWEERVESLRTAAAQGAMTAVDVRDAELSSAEARLTRQGLEQTRAIEQSALALAMGTDPLQAAELETAWTPILEAPRLAALLSALPERRLDLVALRHRSRSRRHALDAAHLAAFPPIRIGWFSFREVDFNTSTGPAITLGIPIFDRNQGQIARQEALIEQVEDQYAARLLSARTDVVGLARQLEHVLEQLETATTAAEHASELAERARAALAQGALTILRLHQIERRAMAVQLRRLQLEQSAAELRVGLTTASGTPL